MLIPIVYIVLGFVALLWSADRLVAGASALAAHFGIPTLIIGLVVVGFGTSAPELVVSAASALSGQTGLAVGNALGSNIANIGLVMGVTALLFPLSVSSNILRREFPALLVVTLLTGAALWDEQLSRANGLVFLGGLLLVTGFISWLASRGKGDILHAELSGEIPEDMGNARACVWIVVGLVVLPISSQVLVTGATEIAAYFGVNSIVIGLTVIAIGTSLPELATCLVAARKREHDMAVGNILGSNMFNLLGVLGVAGSIHPMRLPDLTLLRDFGVMAAFIVVFFFLAYNSQGRGHLSRRAGVLLLVAYVAYVGVLIASAHTGGPAVT